MSRRHTLPRALLATAAAGVLLAGCSANEDELRGWMDQQRREVKPNVTPLAAPKAFAPEPYTSVTAVDPFSTQKLSVAIKQEARQPNSLLASELNRRKVHYPIGSRIRATGPVQRAFGDKIIIMRKGQIEVLSTP